MGVLTLSIVQAICSEGKEECDYKALVLGQTSFQVFLIFVAAVYIVVPDVVVAAHNAVDFVMVVDVVDTVVVDMVAEWEYQEFIVVVDVATWISR